MRTVVVGSEKNFATLRPVVFERKISAAEARSAAKAIREANPHANLNKLEPGTVLTIPEGVPGVAAEAAPTLSVGSTDAIAALAARGKQGIGALAKAAKARDSTTKAERKRVAKALESKGAQDASKRDKRLAKDLAAARAALDEEESRGKERAAELQKAQTEWSAGLDALASLAQELAGVPAARSKAR